MWTAVGKRSGDHPEVLRRSVLTVKASKRRIEMTEKNSKRQVKLWWLVVDASWLVSCLMTDELQW